MLMYGDANNIISTGNIYNMTSLREGYEKLPTLIPPNDLGRFTGKEFDIAYANYIMSNDLAFSDFFKIIFSLYIGTDVYLIVSENDWSENLIESLLKFIQQRYGYTGIKINYIDDYIQATNSKFQPEFNPYYGLQNLDIDKERFTYLVEYNRIKNGGPLIMGEL